MITQQTEVISYRTGRLASLFASHSDYESFSLVDDEIILAGGASGRDRISYLTIGPGITIERGYFWDVLAIHLENGEILRFGGVAKNQSGALQTALNHHSSRHIRTFYQRLALDLQKAYRTAGVLFSGQHYIRYTVAQQWFKNHQHLAEGIKRQDIHRFLPPEVLQCLQTIRPLLNQGYDYIAKRNEFFLQQQLAAFQLFFDKVESNPLTENQRRACVIDEQHNLVLAEPALARPAP